MVQSNSTENKCWTLPEPETTRGKRAIKSKDIEQQKRLKSSSVQTTKQWSLDSNESPVPHSHYNPLSEPGPLGLKQARVGISGPVEKSKGSDVKARVGISGPVEKLKASNFPAALLKIGNWEWVSKYEGDLVGKCYFGKQKLIWEVLDGRLKNKIEIQWGDIVGLKANCPGNGPGTLTIVLGKQPLFFREIDPQPRKHTIWQPTSDFTGGEASTCWQHYLQCSQGVLNKHYEKLIQCDTRLNFLSQQVDPFPDSPFAAKDSIKDPNVSNNNVSNQPEMSKGLAVSCIKNTGPLDLVHGVFIEEPTSSSLRLVADFSPQSEGRRCAVMGAYTYVSELWRKKQSDVMRFMQRVRCWEYRQLPSIVRVTHPTRPDKARRMGYKAKQGYVIYRVRVRRGGRKRPVPKGIVYGKPTNQGVTQLKFQRSKRSVAEERAGRKLGGLKVLNSYWLNEDSTYKYFEVILVDPAHAAIRNDPRINWICNPVHKHRELRGLTSAGKKYRGLRGKGHLNHKARPSRRATWKRNNTLSLRRYR
ncbi:hypothetical protein L1987_35382 [Smallanthus sonchifolius]|uniref:Uncharacterized protein n=1 Tax=Smallanthus sonchifolius TaxID=185202 RepID=A0ACB9HWF6_9ASTR|nr:hypothetical protein L1987_35382 [Smallanthus sonchifolius]